MTRWSYAYWIEPIRTCMLWKMSYRRHYMLHMTLWARQRERETDRERQSDRQTEATCSYHNSTWQCFMYCATTHIASDRARCLSGWRPCRPRSCSSSSLPVAVHVALSHHAFSLFYDKDASSSASSSTKCHPQFQKMPTSYAQASDHGTTSPAE